MSQTSLLRPLHGDLRHVAGTVRADRQHPDAAGAGGVDNLAQSATGGMTTVLGAKFRECRARLVQPHVDSTAAAPFFDPSISASRTSTAIATTRRSLRVTGGFNISAATSTTGVLDQRYQASDDLTLIKGRHQFGVGRSYAYWKSSQTSHARSGGSWMFNGTITAAALRSDGGRVGSLEHGVPNLLIMDMNYIGSTRRTSGARRPRHLQLRARWEPYLGQQMLYGGANIFNHDNFVNNVKSQVFVNAPAGLLYPATPASRAARAPTTSSGSTYRRVSVSRGTSAETDVSRSVRRTGSPTTFRAATT
jgi:hypothetical protein